MASSWIKTVPVPGYGIGTRWYKNGIDKLDENVIEALVSAAKVGYRHFDAAEGYGTEPELGVAIKKMNLKRSEIFVTTKVLKNIADPVKALKNSLQNLQLEYVDLYLIHSFYFTTPSLEEAWKQLEECVNLGLTKAIGVSNFRIEDLKRVLAVAKVKPFVNQVELHPYLPQRTLRAFMKENDIIPACYAPLFSLTHHKGGPVDPVVDKLAIKYGKTQAQILLRWNQQIGSMVITTTANLERQKQQLHISDFTLTDAELKEIEDAGLSQVTRKFWGHVKEPNWDPQ